MTDVFQLLVAVDQTVNVHLMKHVSMASVRTHAGFLSNLVESKLFVRQFLIDLFANVPQAGLEIHILSALLMNVKLTMTVHLTRLVSPKSV